MTPVSLAQAIPVKVRKVVYSVLVTLYGLELVFDVVDSALQERLLAAAAVLGFAIAIPNTPTEVEVYVDQD